MIHNHLENNREITTKTGLIRSLRLFYTSHDPAVQCLYQVHDTIATSFIITAQYEDTEYQLFMNRFMEIANMHSVKERTPAKHCAKNMWLIKPAALNQGKGIEVCRTIKEITKSFRNKPLNSLWIIQKYIEKPLLFKGRKFDIRMWALATAKHELFYYKNGYLRTSSSEYDPEATDNYIHLTNNCLQKYGDNYGMHEKGNTLSFQAFQEYLDTEFPQYKLNFERHFLQRMIDLMIDTYLSSKKIIHKGKRKTVFELFGYDFLIDEDFRVWLIEVNTNPYLGVPNEYIEGVLPEMLDDMLEITVDHYIPPKYPKERGENNFELIYADHGSAFNKEGINVRQSYNSPIYPVAELAQIPLSKQCLPTRNEEEQPKLIVKDLLQIVKQIIDTSSFQDILEFTEITNRVVSQINNWELLSEEQLSSSLQSLKLISSSNGSAVLLDSNNLSSMIGIISSEDIPENIQICVLDACILACHNMRFRKEIVKNGFISCLVNISLNSSNINLREIGLQALLALCTNPTKGVYVPGKSREHIWIKEKMITEGGILTIMKIAKTITKDSDEKIEKLEKIEKILANEFHLVEWEAMIEAITKILNGNSSLKTILDPSFLQNIKLQIEESNSIKREEIKLRQEREKLKREEEDEEKRKKTLILQQQLEEKKLKASEYINKRYDEIRKEKQNDLKKQNKLGKTIEDRLIEEKRHALLLKLKRAEELKLIQENKIKFQEQQLKKKEKIKKKYIQEKRPNFMNEYSRLRGDLAYHNTGKNIEERELDKIFNKPLNYTKKGYEKLDTIDDSLYSIPDNYFSKIESSRYIESIVNITTDKKESTRRFSPIISRHNLFKIYGRALSNVRVGKTKKNNSEISV